MWKNQEELFITYSEWREQIESNLIACPWCDTTSTNNLELLEDNESPIAILFCHECGDSFNVKRK